MRVLATFKQGLKNPPTHTFHDTDEDFLAAASTYDGLGKNVYHACATYATGVSRKGENVEAVKALWVDLDVGPTKPHATQRDAALSIAQFTKALGLEIPHLVKSGGGIHAYFAFTKSITPEQWQRLAPAFAACLDHFGVKHDTSRTQDVASILRVPDTHNYKTDPPKDVVLLRLGGEDAAGSIYSKFKAYADANGVLLDMPVRKGKAMQETNELVGARTHAPSEGPLIEEHCPVIAEVAESGGLGIEYATWWGAMGIAKHTTDPATVAAHWTRDRAKGEHDKTDPIEGMDSWHAGPATCEYFSRTSSACATCAHRGKIVTPLHLGTPEIPAVEPVPVVEEVQDIPTMPGEWEFGAKWIMDRVARRLKIGFAGGGLTMAMPSEDGGPNKHEVLCERYWQVMRRIRDEEGNWHLEIGFTRYGKMETLLLPSSAVTAPDKLKSIMSEKELHIRNGTKGVYKTQEKLMFEQAMLHNYLKETVTYPVMGWATANNTANGHLTGDFVIGSTLIRPKTPQQPIILSQDVPSMLRHDFKVRGSTEEWVDIVDRIYNRRGAEPYQFILAAMFAAPLVRLVPGQGDWHGIPIALCGDSGAAKTSTALVAMSIYAPPQLLKFNANSSKDGGQGDTTNALAIKIGTLNNLPFVADEMTEVEPEKVSAIMFMLQAGRQKDRATPSSKLVENKHRWDTLSIITGNESLHEKLRQVRSQFTQEATQLRCFEVSLRKSDLKQVFSTVSKTDIEVNILEEQYGCVGRDWLQWVVNNREAVAEQLGRARKIYKIDDTDTSEIRFYMDLLMTVEVAARMAKRKGFIRWDVDAMMRWAKSQLLAMKYNVLARDWEGTISDFFASLHGRTIVSRHMKVGPGRRTIQEMPLEPLSTVTPPVARKAIDDKIFIVTVNALNAWAQDNRIMPSTMLGEMKRLGYITIRTGEKIAPRMVNIGSGTTVARPQAPCYEFDYDRVVNFSAADTDSSPLNVLPFPVQPTEVVTESVTVEVVNGGESAAST